MASLLLPRSIGDGINQNARDSVSQLFRNLTVKWSPSPLRPLREIRNIVLKVDPFSSCFPDQIRRKRNLVQTTPTRSLN